MTIFLDIWELNRTKYWRWPCITTCILNLLSLLHVVGHGKNVKKKKKFKFLAGIFVCLSTAFFVFLQILGAIVFCHSHSYLKWFIPFLSSLKKNIYGILLIKRHKCKKIISNKMYVYLKKKIFRKYNYVYMIFWKF